MQSEISKKEYWESHIKKWETSNLSQKSYCEEEKIKLTTFVFWKSHLNKASKKKFIPLEIKPSLAETTIKIKMLTGNVIFIPCSLGIVEISKLIHLLEIPNA